MVADQAAMRPRHQGLHRTAASAEGKTEREAIRCVKRYLARRVWRLLEHPPTALDRHRSIRPFRGSVKGLHGRTL